VACSFIALAAAQTPPSVPPSNPNNDWLAQTAKLYYSSAKSGLKGFDCALQPDWQAFFAAKDGGQVSALDVPAVSLLNSVKVAVHTRMDGGTIIDWNPPSQQLDSTQTALLDQMHGAVNQMVQGFVQFWTPFIEDQVVPDSADGLDMTTTADAGRQIHVAAGQVEVTEIFDSGHILRQYNVTMSGTKILLTPTYLASDHGLLVSQFHALVQPSDNSQKAQEMNVAVTYQWIDGFPLPGQLHMEVVSVAGLNFSFQGCTVQR
jgi:hypothetical protein